MSTTKVTVALPTYNRARLLKLSLESILAQDYPDFRVVVLDNASTDETSSIVRSFADPRVSYIRNETNIGLWRNWNRAVEMNSSPYLSVFNDDDVMLPGFIRESVRALDEHPTVGFSVALSQLIDIEGHLLQVQDPREAPAGLIEGLEFLQLMVDQRAFIIYPSSVLLRAAALAVVGRFDSPHGKMSMDFNLFLRIASRFDVFFIRKDLIQYRLHQEQETKNQMRAAQAVGWYAMLAEMIDAIAYLLRSARAEDRPYRDWLAERLLILHRHQSAAMHSFVPSSYHSWEERLQVATQTFERLFPPGSSFILVDNEQLGISHINSSRRIPFLEKDGVYWGAPPDDITAIRELERLRQSGASFMAFAWPAFWWLDEYSGLHLYLRSNFRCVLENSHLVIFDLRH